VTTEAFVVAFLRVLEPFAEMLGDLLRLFERHGVRETGTSAAIAFDFDAIGGDELTFDLENFAETRRVLETVMAQVATLSIDRLPRPSPRAQSTSRRSSRS
jgi:hypothetical protein